eukprot:Clim_evm47s191 gene=Clim_evmTU47s191
MYRMQKSAALAATTVRGVRMASRRSTAGFGTLTRAARYNGARVATVAARPTTVAGFQAVRTKKTLDFGGTSEEVIERSDYPKEKLQEIFKDDTLAMLGYGPQGRGQALNARDNGLKVIVGVRENGRSWKIALEDGWQPGKDLFSVEEAADKGTVIMNLLSDAAQKSEWSKIVPYLTSGKTLYFAHGFSVVYKEQTGVIPPKDVDVILAAPKGSGTTVRNLFLQGRGINASYAVFQDVSGKAVERAQAIAIAVGAGYVYQTTFEKEVWSDLTGERGVLMGAIEGMFRAQYEVLREAGHTPSEAFNETVEEATQSLYPLIGDKGMDWMYANCSTTAQRGALDWAPKFYEATKPTFKELYQAVRDGSETARTLDVNSRPDYRESLEKELEEVRNSEMWRAGKTVRTLRPENQ